MKLVIYYFSKSHHFYTSWQITLASGAEIQMNGYKHIWCSHSKFEPHRIMKEVTIKWHKIISTKPATMVPQESIRQQKVWKHDSVEGRRVEKVGAYSCIHISLYLCIHMFLYSCIIISWYSCTMYPCTHVFRYPGILASWYSCIHVSVEISDKTFHFLSLFQQICIFMPYFAYNFW